MSLVNYSREREREKTIPCRERKTTTDGMGKMKESGAFEERKDPGKNSVVEKE